MKRIFYIFSFGFLGFLLQFLAHIFIERWYIGLLINDFAKYGFGMSWNSWFLIHHIGSVVFMIAGIFFGIGQGIYWWKILYESHTNPKKD